MGLNVYVFTYSSSSPFAMREISRMKEKEMNGKKSSSDVDVCWGTQNCPKLLTGNVDKAAFVLLPSSARR